MQNLLSIKYINKASLKMNPKVYADGRWVWVDFCKDSILTGRINATASKWIFLIINVKAIWKFYFVRFMNFFFTWKVKLEKYSKNISNEWKTEFRDYFHL